VRRKKSENKYIYYVINIKILYVVKWLNFKPLSNGVDSNYVLGGLEPCFQGSIFPQFSTVFSLGKFLSG